MPTIDIDKFNRDFEAKYGPEPVLSPESLQKYKEYRILVKADSARASAYVKLHARESRARAAARKAGKPLPEYTPSPFKTVFNEPVPRPITPGVRRAPRKPVTPPDFNALFTKALVSSCDVRGLTGAADNVLAWWEASNPDKLRSVRLDFAAVPTATYLVGDLVTKYRRST